MIEVYYDNKFLFHWENYNNIPDTREGSFFINCDKLYEVKGRDFFGNTMRIFIKSIKSLIEHKTNNL